MESLLEGIPAHDAERLVLTASLSSAYAVTPLAGGITNRNYRLRRREGDVVVRLSDPEASLLAIDRENEYRNSVAAAESGAAPAVVEYLPGKGVLVVGWVEGRTYDEQDVCDPANLPRIAAACRILHGGPAFANRFDMFEIQAGYLAHVLAGGFRLPPRYREFETHVERIRAAFAVHGEPLVPCNNDLLAANVIDDGDRLWLIDYEYSGANEASFELGNIWSEASAPDDLLPVLVEAYWGRADPAKVARARLWALMSKYGWTLWASIQDAVSPIEFDYWSWGMEKYERAVAEFDGPEFDRWLDASAGG